MWEFQNCVINKNKNSKKKRVFSPVFNQTPGLIHGFSNKRLDMVILLWPMALFYILHLEVELFSFGEKFNQVLKF